MHDPAACGARPAQQASVHICPLASVSSGRNAASRASSAIDASADLATRLDRLDEMPGSIAGIVPLAPDRIKWLPASPRPCRSGTNSFVNFHVTPPAALETYSRLNLKCSRRHEVSAAERGQKVVERDLVRNIQRAEPQGQLPSIRP